jgi:valyl-tRNA synthetase
VPDAKTLALIHRWILHRLNAVTREVHEALGTFRFDVAADRLYHFFWDEYADWYIEMVKPHLQARDGGQGAAGDLPRRPHDASDVGVDAAETGLTDRDTARAVLVEVHDRILRLLHPIIPFVTEELWQKLPRRSEDGQTISLAPWPVFREEWDDDASVPEIELLQGVVTTIRTARAERTVKPSARIAASLEGASPDQRLILDKLKAYVMGLAGLSGFDFVDANPAGEDIVTRVYGDLRVHIVMPHMDRSAEVEKLRRQLAEKAREVAGVDAKLSNESFISRAPAQVVDGARAQRNKLVLEQQRIEETLRELGG